MWFFSSRRKRRKASAPVRRPSRRPQLEVLEDRCLLSAGALDPAFGSGAGYVTASAPQGGRVLLQPDGKVVVASYEAAFTLARFNTDGSLDTSFDNGGIASTPSIQGSSDYSYGAAALQANGDILEGGEVPINGKSEFALVRYTPNGVLDSSFGNQGTVSTNFGSAVSSATISEILVQLDGKIIAVGGTGGAGPNILLARYNADGSLDATFGTNGLVNLVDPSVSQPWVSDARLQSDGKIVTVGSSIITGQQRAYEVARFNSDGSLDTSFGTLGLVRTSFGLTGSNDYASDLAIQADGKIVVVGTSSYDVSGDHEWSMARYDSSGNLDPTFGSGGKVTDLITSTPDTRKVASSPTLQSDGKIVVVGTTGPTLAVARYDAFGNRDSTFGTAGVMTSAIGTFGISSVIYPQDGTSNDGKIVVAGNSGSSPNAMLVARFQGDTAAFAVAGFPSPTTAGQSGTFTVTAKNASGGTATGYTGTVHFTSSDPQAVLPADYTLTAADQGVHTFSATLKTAGTQSLTVTDTATGANEMETGILVSPAMVSQLGLGFPSPTNAGLAASLTVTAQDAFGNTVSGYTGTVHFSSSDPAAQLPADYTFTTADNGAHTFSATLNTTGTQSLTATDTTGSLTGTQAGITVDPASLPAVTFSVTGFPSPTTAGVLKSITVTARDANGNVAGSYRGTVHLTSSDPRAVLPYYYTFTNLDQGAHTFPVALLTAGSQSLTATDTVTGSITGKEAGISITAAAAVQFVLAMPLSVKPGATFTMTLTVEDAFGNAVPNYTGTVHFTSSDGMAKLPANYTFTAADAGVHKFSAILRKKGTQTITVTDVLNSALTATDTTNVF
jgi:uncharacterized delta-60 repeat protein